LLYLKGAQKNHPMHHITGQDREQIRMVSLGEMVEEESMVRVIDAFVDMLDLASFQFTYFKLNLQGRPPFHPSTMLKIYFYGYQNGIRSCRQLEKACRTNIEMMWLIHEQRPHYKTIANFRKDNARPFKEVFRYFVAILKDWKLIDGRTIAIDSFKIRAQNSLKNNFNERKVKRHLEYIDGRIAEYEGVLSESDDEVVLEKLEGQKIKRKRYTKIGTQLNETSDGQISTTDVDARAVVFQRNSVKVGYNVQAASDGKYKLLIAADTGDVNDTKALSVMVGKVQENIGKQGMRQDILGDKGYHSGREMKACEGMGVDTYISPKASSSSKKNPAYAMDQFKYYPRTDTYECPAGERLRTNGVWYDKNLKNGRKSYRVKHYKTKSCKECSLRSECTKNKLGRIIERTEYAEYVVRNNNRVNRNPDYYRQRQQIIEHQFGTLKRHKHFDYTLMKGKENVLGEVYLAFTMYNLSRSLSIFGFSGLIRLLRGLLDNIFAILDMRGVIKAHNEVNSFKYGMLRGAWYQMII
jgi:transposase